MVGRGLQTIRNHLVWREHHLHSHQSTLEFPALDGSGDRLTGTLEKPTNLTRSSLTCSYMD